MFPPLEAPIAGAVPLRIGEFVDRALWDEGGSLDDAVVRLEGFVVHDPEVPDGFVLARFRIACCAADAIPIKVAVLDAARVPAEDQWVAVTGVAASRPEVDPDATTLSRVEITAQSIEEIAAPESPYE